MDFTEKTLEKEYLFRGRVVTLHKDRVLTPEGKETTREVCEHGGGVCILALTEEGEVLLVRQYRYAAGKELLELPAGKLEAGEDPRECGIRELREETGARAESFEHLASFYSTPGFCSEIIHIYVAEGLTFGSQHLDPNEFLEVLRVPLERAKEMALSGEIEDGKTIIGILSYLAGKKA